MDDRRPTPMLGFAAWSGTGKTTLLRKLIPVLREKGIRVGIIKHAHHDFDIDIPGKDSHELRKAGADQVLVASKQRSALIVEHDSQKDPALDELYKRLNHELIDLVLVEGFRDEEFVKIELHRSSMGKPLLYPDDPSIIAIASDGPVLSDHSLVCLDLNRPDQIVEFIISYSTL